MSAGVADEPAADGQVSKRRRWVLMVWRGMSARPPARAVHLGRLWARACSESQALLAAKLLLGM